MEITGRFFDVDEGEPINQAVVRADGDEIAFDMNHSDGYRYSVVLIRNNGTIFTGRAVSHPGNEVAEVTCRVLVDRLSQLVLISGSKWQYTGATNHKWFAELQLSSS